MRVFITGAGRGIGRGLALAYGAAGATVHATVRTTKAAAELEKSGMLLHQLDVTDDAACRRVAADLVDTPLDLLINNAGVSDDFRGLDELDFARMLRVYDVNAFGALRVTRALLPNLRAARGRAVHMTSRMGSIADNQSGQAYAYRMSKAALNMACKNLSIDLRPMGILSVVLHPGWVKTDMGGPGGNKTVEVAVSQLIATIDRLTLSDSGRFFDAEGRELPW